jgi:hypothetical protein
MTATPQRGQFPSQTTHLSKQHSDGEPLSLLLHLLRLVQQQRHVLRHVVLALGLPQHLFSLPLCSGLGTLVCRRAPDVCRRGKRCTMPKTTNSKSVTDSNTTSIPMILRHCALG